MEAECMNTIIEVKNLTKSFGSLTAVNGVSFSVPKGVCFGLLGPNGAGKTTTIEMLEGIVPPTTGEILYGGQPATKAMYQSLGVQFQSTALQDFLTVSETLTLFSSLYPKIADVDELIELCELKDYLHQDHRKLSGGQRQRLLLALALINDPEIIFLDEPTTGLDPHARRNFWDLITAIKAREKTLILTTHYMDEAEYLCDDIAIMEKGQIIAHDSPQELLRQNFEGALIRIPEENAKAKSLDGINHRVYQSSIEIITAEIESTIKALMERDISLSGLHVKSANLDDLFLKLTGHALAE